MAVVVEIDSAAAEQKVVLVVEIDSAAAVQKETIGLYPAGQNYCRLRSAAQIRYHSAVEMVAALFVIGSSMESIAWAPQKTIVVAQIHWKISLVSFVERLLKEFAESLVSC